MGEGDNRRSDEPEERWEDQSRDPFWLDAERGPGSGRAFGRLADLTDQAAAAAKRAAEAIRAELESVTGATQDAGHQGSEEAQLLRSASARLTRFDREASGLARLLRQAREPESPGAARVIRFRTRVARREGARAADGGRRLSAGKDRGAAHGGVRRHGCPSGHRSDAPPRVARFQVGRRRGRGVGSPVSSGLLFDQAFLEFLEIPAVGIQPQCGVKLRPSATRVGAKV